MKNFIHEDFLLQTETARNLFHNHAEVLPIIDYHCHLNPKEIAEDHQFKSITELWLGGDHYKWRLLRANGVNEKYITGDATDWEKFEKWAETIPYTMRNPMYHWTHLELKRVFNIDNLLNTESAREIYDMANEMLRKPEYSSRGLMKRFGVEVVCTTDDPLDSLEYHKQIKASEFEIKVLPTWRPDKSMAVENGENFRKYIDSLSEVSDININSFDDYFTAITKRHDYFKENGCRLADHGIDNFYSEPYSDGEINQIFDKVYNKKEKLTDEEVLKFKSKMLHENALLNHSKGWVQQFHYGAIRNNNSRMFKLIGPDAGYDSINDVCNVARSMSRFFDVLESKNKLAKSIIYNLNPRDNYLIASMIANFQDGTVPGKIQFGSGWWFLDQKDGMEDQMNVLSTQGLLSRFVGMLTDSRSFVSYPRHEYFRRILCNLIGNDVEKGLIPSSEIDFLGKMVEGICYYNAKEYFNF
ncbi:MAG: glucuronate isomerase [Fermentimonas sp.]|nr:glucuronate isomerase [Fermentimonas sp.]MDD4009004.1 glucuronate isomerase [Fermentimonas sp.]MDD4697688.1 glucuronate isomerase [Fermentimonas sp.]